MTKNRIGIIGAGMYGKALNKLFLENKNNEVLIWDLQKVDLENFSTKENVLSCDYLVCAIPSKFVFSFLNENKQFFSNSQKVLIGSKGFGSDGNLLSSIFCDFFDKKNICYLSGPGFANELVEKPHLARLNVSGFDIDVAKEICELFNEKIVNFNLDIISFEITSALKNVAAFVCGITYGKYELLNLKYAVASKVYCEICEIVNYFNGDSLTAISNPLLQADLYMTASQTKSRNFKFGLEVSKGIKFGELVKNLDYMVESIETLNILNKMFENDKNIFSNLVIIPKVVDLYLEKITVEEFFKVIEELDFNCCNLEY